jgi:transposase
MWKTATALQILVEDKQVLERWVKAPSTPQGIALRCSIILLAGRGFSNNKIAKQLLVSRPTVLLWRKRFEQKGPMGLRKIKEGRGRKPEISSAKLERIVHDTLHTKPSGATHWSSRTMASHHKVSDFVVRTVWKAHGLKPHLVKTFKLSKDPDFIEKLRDVVGLYMNPPEHALVFCVDEKSQIQALDRTQPSLPMKKGRAGTMTHDYKRNGTTTLFAALDVMKGEIIGQCMKRHRHQEFLKFLRTIDRNTDKKLDLHLIVDNYCTHKHANVKAWLEKHPRFHFHFIPTSSSWLNLVERWFAEITNKRIRRGVFHSVPELTTAIEDFISHNNENPKPFVWTKSADQIIKKVNRCKAILNSVH